MDDIRAHRIEALPHDRLLEILSRYNRLPR